MYNLDILKDEYLSLMVVCNQTLGELSGEEYKKQLINTLCSSR